MTVLVTGGTGLLGNNLVRLLNERGEAVRVLARGEGTPTAFSGLDLDIRRGDVRDCEAVRSAMQGISSVFHCAAVVTMGWRGMQESRAVNVEGSANVGQAAREAGARMVHVSSIDALGLGTRDSPATESTPYAPHVPCPYAVTKREAEVALLQLAAEGLDLVIINPGFMLGPWDWRPSSGRMLLEVAAGKGVFVPHGMNQFCGALEVAAGAVAARDKGRSGERYIMTGELLSYMEAFRLFAEITGGRKPRFRLRRFGLFLAGKLGDAKTAITGREGDVNSAALAMTRLPRFFSHRKAVEELGYCPRPVRQSAELAWQWFLEHGYASKR